MKNNNTQIKIVNHKRVALLAVGAVLTWNVGVAQADEAFWQEPAQQAVTAFDDKNTEYSALYSSYRAESTLGVEPNRFAKSTWGNREESRVSSFGIAQSYGEDSQVMMQYAQGVEQRNMVMGWRQNDLTISMMRGSGETISELGGHYTGMNPYQFHGGIQQQYRYEGMAFDYDFKRFGHLQYGQADMFSPGLEDRSARYFQWAGDRTYARLTEFERGSDNIGHGLDVGYAFDSAMVGFQAMNLENDKQFQRIRVQFDQPKERQVFVDLFASQNPLYRESDDVGIMLSMTGSLGGFSSRYSAQSGNSVSKVPDPDPKAKVKKKKRRIGKRLIWIGAGVAAGVALASSGSESQDSSGRFDKQHDAAKDVLDRINPKSIRENKEFGGWVFVNQDGSYSSTEPVQGDNDSVRLPARSIVIPRGSAATASYHTHAGFDPRYDNENFSPTDLELNRDLNLDGYLGTPGGLFKYHNVETDQIFTLGRVRTD